ncbi:hypothetical protein SFUMM280S_08251 [Streptomyces fumanus]
MQLGARPGRTLSPDERAQLLGRLADLPPPASTRSLLDILDDLPEFQAPLPLPAPRGWRTDWAPCTRAPATTAPSAWSSTTRYGC